MDVLSDVIASMRTGRPRSARVAWHAPWAQRFASVPGSAGFQVVLRGSCWLLRPGGDPLPLSAGDIIFRPYGEGHTLADDPSTRPAAPPCEPGVLPAYANDAAGGGGPVTVTLCGAYEMDPASVHPLLNDLPDLVHLPAHLGRHPALHATVDLLAGELESPCPGLDAIVPALLDTLLVHILRAGLDRSSEARTGWAAALTDPPVAAALRSMHAEPARRWTVAALAAEAGLSRSPFARRFAELVGQPPLTYLTWWRLTTAARLLRESDAPLGAVAARAGYTSEFAFANAFKRQFGSAPGRYRRAPHPPPAS